MNKRRKEIQFQPNDLVYMRDNTIAQGLEGGATKMPFKGPFIIEAIEDNGKTASCQVANDKESLNLFEPHSSQVINKEKSLNLSTPHSSQVANDQETLNFFEPHNSQAVNNVVSTNLPEPHCSHDDNGKARPNLTISSNCQKVQQEILKSSSGNSNQYFTSRHNYIIKDLKPCRRSDRFAKQNKH